MRELIPLGDRLVVEKVDDPTKTDAGIFLPQTTQSRATEDSVLGQVLAEGETIALSRGRVSALNGGKSLLGLRVLLSPFAGHAAKMNGKDVVIISRADVLAVVVDHEQSYMPSTRELA